MHGSDFDTAYAHMHFGGFLDLALPRGASRFATLGNRARIQCRRMAVFFNGKSGEGVALSLGVG